MNEYELNKRYFDWMYKIACVDRPNKNNKYRKLLSYLDGTTFSYSIEMDGNRAADGIDLRYRFGDEYEYHDSMIASYLDNRLCSVLEMMLALAIRCEESIMGDPEQYGDRTSQWFWTMIINLGLEVMDDRMFNEEYTDRIITTFLNGEYKPNGKGGLFVVQDSDVDLRTVEIWYQMNWYLNELE